MASDAKDLCALADQATKDAKSKGTPASHRDAARAHDKAAKFSRNEGEEEKAKDHLKQASHHRAKAEELHGEGDSNSESQAGEPNPLLTWADAKGA